MSQNAYDRRTALRRGLAVLALGTTTVAGCLDSFGGPSGPTIAMTSDLRFDPAEVTIQVGQQVTWENESRVPHTASAYEDAIPPDATYFASGGYESEQAVRQSRSARGFLERGDTYSHVFEVAGEYRYFCLPHEGSGMVGAVVME